MAQIDSVLIRMEDNVVNANHVKETVLDALLRDKIITEKQHKEYSERWQIIVFKPSWFKKWANVFSKSNLEHYIYKYVKFEY